MENAVTKTGKSPSDHTLESLDKAWRAAKKRVG